MSEKSTLCLVNSSGQSMNITVPTENGFESGSSPSEFLPNSLSNNCSICGFVEMTDNPCDFTVSLTFDSGTLEFTSNQYESKEKHVGVIPHKGTAPNLEVWRSTGGNVGSSTHGTNGIYIRSLPIPDNSGWMGDLLARHPQITLNNLVMPGSHDAGMYETYDYPLGGGGSWAKTQNLSILEQLRAGSRYFDLRICINDDHLQTYHGETKYGAYGAKLGSIIGDVKTFMQSREASSEVIILKFSHSYKNSVERTVQVVKTLGALLYTHATKDANGNSLPKINLATMRLEALKGKVVAVFEDEYSGYWSPDDGIFPYYDTDTSSVPSNHTLNALTVYDNYANDGNYQDMYNDQNQKLTRYGGWGQNFLFLLSWTLSGYTDIRDIEVLAGMANPWWPRKMRNIQMNNSHRPNIVYMDFIDPYLCNSILALNP
jgi:hypothetical protein